MPEQLVDPFARRRKDTVLLAVTLVAVFIAGLIGDWLAFAMAAVAAAAMLRWFWTYVGYWRAYTDASIELARVLARSGMSEDELLDALYTAGPISERGERRG